MLSTLKEFKNRLCISAVYVFTFLFLIFIIYGSIKQSQVTHVAKPEIQNAEILEFENLPINEHKGGSQLNHNDIEMTVRKVISGITNLQNINQENLIHLVLETMIVETLVGKSSYHYASKNYRNYGIAQIREDTANWLLTFLEKSDLDTYVDIMKHFNHSLSLKDNLLLNVPFSIAICAEYYYIRNKNLEKSITNVDSRAKQWKRFYNTSKGKGTEQIYKKRVQQYYALHIIR